MSVVPPLNDRVGVTAMRAFGRVLFILLIAACVHPARVSGQNLRPERCTECHRQLGEERLTAPVTNYPDDVHAKAGFGCLACHGRADGSSAAGFLSKPTRSEIPGLCGRCHSDAAFMRDFNPSLRTDQESEYVTSGHGKRLAQGDEAVATCIDCHKAHRIRPPSDPESSVFAGNVSATCSECHNPDYMAGRSIPTDQFDQWATSVHGRMMVEDGDLSAPTCNDCHGNHGAAPPGIGSIRNVCGQCHATMADFFAQSQHVDLFIERGLPGCETCHGNHAIQNVSDENLAERSDDVCGTCHTPADTVGGEFRAIAVLLDSLKTGFAHSREILETAENNGMEVSEALFELEEVNNALTQARSAVHTFRVEPVAEKVAEGLKLTETGFERGQAAMGEHRFRRVGLGASASIILVLILGLLLKIRQLDRRVMAGDGGTNGEKTHA